VGVVFTPIIPYICDSEKNLREVIERAYDSGARYVLSGSMTLRSNQKTRFLELLRKNYPNLLKRYLDLYRDSQNPDSRYQTAINRKTFELCRQLGIPTHITPPSFERPFRENLEVANMLLLYAYFTEMKTGNSYATWAYHKAAQSIEELHRDIRHIYEENRLAEIHGVGQSISRMIADFLENGRSEKLEETRSTR